VWLVLAAATLPGCGRDPGAAPTPVPAPDAAGAGSPRPPSAGVELVLAPAPHADWTPAIAREAAERLRRRLAAAGMADATVEAAADGRLHVGVTGDEPARLARVRTVALSPGFLELRLVASEAEVGRWEPPAAPPGHRWVRAHNASEPPELVRLDDADVTGVDVADARVVPGPFGDFAVEATLTAAGSERLGRLTGQHVGRRLAIVWDDRVLLAPVIQERITGRALLTPAGGLPREEADQLAALLRVGPMPAPLGLVEERRVEPQPR
jgi:preprotein translocase subunit SecD